MDITFKISGVEISVRDKKVYFKGDYVGMGETEKNFSEIVGIPVMGRVDKAGNLIFTMDESYVRISDSGTIDSYGDVEDIEVDGSPYLDERAFEGDEEFQKWKNLISNYSLSSEHDTGFVLVECRNGVFAGGLNSSNVIHIDKIDAILGMGSSGLIHSEDGFFAFYRIPSFLFNPQLLLDKCIKLNSYLIKLLPEGEYAIILKTFNIQTKDVYSIEGLKALFQDEIDYVKSTLVNNILLEESMVKLIDRKAYDWIDFENLIQVGSFSYCYFNVAYKEVEEYLCVLLR